MEQELVAGLGEGQIAEFVENDEIEPRVSYRRCHSSLDIGYHDYRGITRWRGGNTSNGLTQPRNDVRVNAWAERIMSTHPPTLAATAFATRAISASLMYGCIGKLRTSVASRSDTASPVAGTG